MRSLYSRFVLFLIRPALERWAAEKEAAQCLQVKTCVDGMGYRASGGSPPSLVADLENATESTANAISGWPVRK